LLSAEVENDNVANGDLHCSTCDRNYPIRNGIVHFINPQELEGKNQNFARYYNRLALIYSLFSKFALLPFGGERKARKEILERLDLDGGRILEVSIGNGVNLPYIFELSNTNDIFGIDISIGMLSKCRRLINKRDWQLDLFLAMAEALPFRAETFDKVLHIGGINFFANKKQAIEEMIRVARPGGKIVIADEVERLAKQVHRSVSLPPRDQGGGAIETTINNLVPGRMQEIRMEGIWRIHGQYHGYCLEFNKPL
jgi:ubiquinone/menaquinone biosynthesis C-methylase UbiE